MKTKFVIVVLLLGAVCLKAGPVDLKEIAPTPPTSVALFGTGFELSVFGDGLWTLSSSVTDRYFRTDKAFGGSALGQYFFTPNIGVGVGFSGYAVKNSLGPAFGSDRRFVGDAVLAVTYRYPIGSFAPYVRLGLGGIFNGGNKSVTEPSGTVGKVLRFEIAEHDAKLLAQPAVGVEYKLSPSISFFGEGLFDKVDRPHSNAVGARAGIGYSF